MAETIRELAAKKLFSLDPPKAPQRPSGEFEGNPNIVSAIVTGLTVGPFVGGFVGGIIGMILAMFTRGDRTLAGMHAAQNSVWLGTIVVCAGITAILSFFAELSGDPHQERQRAERNQTLANARAEYERRLSAYKQAMAQWPQELERRKTYNAAILRARAEVERLDKIEAERAKNVKAWENAAERTLVRLRAWRTEFFAMCVAAHGPRTDAELERLYVEAFPHSPLSGDSRLGRLHGFTHLPFVASIKHLLPPEIPRP